MRKEGRKVGVYKRPWNEPLMRMTPLREVRVDKEAGADVRTSSSSESAENIGSSQWKGSKS